MACHEVRVPLNEKILVRLEPEAQPLHFRGGMGKFSWGTQMFTDFPEQTDTYDPDTLQALGRVFDEAWEGIAGLFQKGETIQVQRNELALVILGIARNAEQDMNEIKDVAIAIMRGRHYPSALNEHSQGLAARPATRSPPAQ